MSENNKHTVLYRDGFDVYWGEENQEQAPDDMEKESQPEIDANIKNRQDNIHEQIEHPLNGVYGCP